MTWMPGSSPGMTTKDIGDQPSNSSSPLEHRSALLLEALDSLGGVFAVEQLLLQWPELERGGFIPMHHSTARVHDCRLDGERRLRGDAFGDLDCAVELFAGFDDLLHEAEAERGLGV